ncbi:MAG: S41 family peptidase [Candidatus Peregrinibacteria bacterium]
MPETLKKISLVILPFFGFLIGLAVAQTPEPLEKTPLPTISAAQTPASSSSPAGLGVCIPSSDNINTDVFLETLATMQKEFVDPEKIDPKKISEYMTRGLVSSVGDPYTDFFTAEEAEDFTKDLNGDLEGIGAALHKKNGAIEVEEVLRKTPAAKMGLMPKDIIITVDGKETKGLSLPEVVGKIRGKKGTSVKLSIYREGRDSALELTIPRDTIHVESVESKMQDGVAILTVSQFAVDTTALFQKYLREALLKDPKGIIIDLRYNTGGYLDGAVEMASFFLPNHEKVVTVGYRHSETGAKQEEAHFTSDKKMTDLPVAILINGGTASAAEIFAGALRDYKRATIVGEKSFGKGSVQKFFSIGKNGEKMKMTIAKWFTPNGENITESKIVPNIEVIKTPEDFEKNHDPQIEKALEVIKGK